MTDAERSRRYRERQGAKPRGELKPHGTNAAVRRHERDPEKYGPIDDCPECLKARRDWWTKQNKRRAKIRRESKARQALEAIDASSAAS